MPEEDRADPKHRLRDRHGLCRGVLIVSAAILLAGASPAVAGRGGKQLWAVRSWSADAAIGTVVSPDGSRVFVAGDDNSAYVTAAYQTTNGKELWFSRYEGTGEFVRVRALAMSPNGRTLFETGEAELADSDAIVYATVAYDAFSGALLWVAQYQGPDRDPLTENNDARALSVSPDGTEVFVTGQSYGRTATQDDYATVAYRADSGQRLWAERYNGPASREDAATGIGVSPDGSTIYVTGESRGSTGQRPGTVGKNYATVAYGAQTGAQLWVARYSGPGPRYRRYSPGWVSPSIAVSHDGSEVLIAGTKSVSGDRLDYATVAYESASGSRLWTRTYNGIGNGDDIAESLTMSSDGSKVFVIGESTGELVHKYAPDNLDYETIAYDSSTGQCLWKRRYNGPKGGEDVATSVATSGNVVFVTGGSKGIDSGPSDYGTIAYQAASGSRLWVSLYDDPAHRADVSLAIAIAPDGTKVFVTGQSTYSQYALVAYLT